MQELANIGSAHPATTTLIARMTVEVDDTILSRVRLTPDEHNIAGNILILPEINTLQVIASKLETMITDGTPG